MLERIAQDWVAYLFIVGIFAFFLYVIIKSNLQYNKENKESRNKEKGKK